MNRAGKKLAALLLVLFLLLPDAVIAGITGNDKNRGAHYLVRKGIPEDAYRKDEVIIKFKPGFKRAAVFAKKNKLTILKGDAKLGYFLARTPKNTDLIKLFTSLKKDPDVQFVQPNFVYRPFKTFNDAQYSRQWALKKINAEKGWDITRGSRDIIVAILDTGVDNKHPELQGRLVAGTNTVNPLRSTRDDNGHGTHVAGIVAASANNGVGIAGLADVRIMPVKVFDEYYGGSDTSVSDGIIWAADHGARVINMSFGSFYRSPLLNDAIEYAREKGVVMVAAAGNWASEDISYPAALKDVIAVSATNSKDEISRFSSYGPEIDVCAPGEDIYSTYWDPFKGSSYREESGTSMASPMVAGLAALLLSKQPGMTADQVREIIEASATDLGEPGWDPKFGHGRIDVYKALTTSFAHTDSENNTRDRARPVIPGQAVTGKIDYGSDMDWFKVSLPYKGALQVVADPAGLVSPAVEIYDAAGVLLAAFNSAENGAAEAFGFGGATIKVAETVYGMVPDLDAGMYFIKVFGNHNRWSGENYRLAVNVFTEREIVKDKYEPNDSIEEAKTISIFDRVEGAITGQEDVDWYKITLDSDRFYQLDVNVPPGLDLVVEVTNEEEYFQEFIDNAGQGENETGVFRTTKKGGSTYYIGVYDKYGASVNALYQLNVKDYTPPADRNEPNNTWQQATSVRVGDKVYANFSDFEDEDWYRIEVKDKGILEIGVGVKDNEYPYLVIYEDPKREPLGYLSGWDYNDKDNRNSSLEVKVSPGTYYLMAAGGLEARYSEYTLTFKYQHFNFIDHEDNDLPAKANPLNIGEIRQGTLFPQGDTDFYVVDVVKPEPILVNLIPPKDLDTSVVVLKERDPDEEEEGKGRKVREKPVKQEEGTDGSSEPYLDFVTEIDSGEKGQPDIGVFVPRKPGRYYIVVRDHDGPGSRSTYFLSLKPFKFLPDKYEDNNTLQKAKPITRNTVVEPTFMGIEDIDWFKVYIPAPTWLNVTMKVPDDIDGVVEVFDGGGRWLGKIDYALAGEEETGSIYIAKAGWYYLKNYDYLGNSSVRTYSLKVNWTEPVKKK